MNSSRIKGLVSVVVTNYNNEKYIEECLNSLISQSYENIEIIIVDDCSTDNSVNLINSWISKRSYDEREKIKFIKMHENVGFSGAVTIGLYLAGGEYIAMQDGDDVSHSNRIKLQVEYLKADKDIMMVGSNYYVFYDDISKAEIKPNFVVYGKGKIEEDFANGHNPVSFGTILFKGEIFDRLGGLTRRLDGAEDYEFISRALVFGIDNLKEALYFYRSHENQRSRIYYSGKNDKRKRVNKESLSVLLALDKLNIGGTETHVLTLTRQLIKEGVKVTLLAGDGPLLDEFKKLNCKIYNIDFPPVIPREKKIRDDFIDKIYKIIDNEHINVVHAHQSTSGNLVVEAAEKLNIPSVFTVHGMYYYDILSTTLKAVDRVISVSIPVYRWLLKFNIDSIVIPNGIPFNNYVDSKNDFLRKEYNIPEDSLGIVYCSRMAWGKVKVCENLIESIKNLRLNEGIKYHGIIIGDGPGYGELKEAGDKVNEVLDDEVIHFTGNQIDVNKYYLGGDCVVGTGRVAIEAMSAFKKVIGAGNCGYFGLVSSENFNESWKSYFGDHGLRKKNDEKYLYDDMKKYYLEKDNYDKDIYDVYDKSRDLFEITKVTRSVIDVYIDELS